MSVLPFSIQDWSRDQKEGLRTYLERFVTDERKEKIPPVLVNRTRHISVVLENIYQPHNASAVLRSCEIFGIQDVYAIEGKYPFQPNREIAMGAGKWVNLHRYRHPEHDTEEHPNAHVSTDYAKACFADLRQKGYKIAVTALREDSIPLCEMPLDHKVALVFGTERHGVSPLALEEADIVVRIPMFGFTQSFNISVSAALCLYDITTRLHASTIPWQLTDEENLNLHITWLLHSIARGEEHVRRFKQEANIRAEASPLPSASSPPSNTPEAS